VWSFKQNEAQAMAEAVGELEQLAWGSQEFEQQRYGFWAAITSERGQELLEGTGLVRSCSSTEQQNTAWGMHHRSAAADVCIDRLNLKPCLNETSLQQWTVFAEDLQPSGTVLHLSICTV
jgi:hypothetical protein